MSTSEVLTQIFQRLFSAYGPQHWWPGDTPFEVCIGAILTQNTSWANVERAIENLKKRGVFDPDSLLEMDHEDLAALVRPAGYFNQKARKIRDFLIWFKEIGGFEGMEQVETSALRESLLSVRGIGPETADSILLYALGRPVFVVDAYTMRVLARHDIVGPDADYEAVQSLFHDNLPREPQIFNEFHALFVRLGKTRCRRRGPLCEDCPLHDLPGYPPLV
ncbi:MAG: endonuclease III domain-containing protein [candidate division WOR-3 bacterium]